ncbi:MAG: 4-hydroxy-tetrahydrodipicolinate synthase [Pseudomonadota bacterium]
MTKISGSITALITPFLDEPGKPPGAVLDEDRYRSLIERQLKAGTHGLVAVGTTGESATLSHREHKHLISICVETVAGRAPVIAGAGSNATSEAIEIAQHAEDAGADALLTVTGYYNKPSQAGLIAHYRALHENTTLPIILYNVPGRTRSELSIETIAELSTLERIVGVKDATGDLARVALQRVASGPDFIQLSGEDMTAVGFNAMGGRGCIGVTANVAPALCAEMHEACARGDYSSAIEIQDQLAPLHDALFADTSPGPVKYAMSVLGLCEPTTRLPLVEPPEDVKAQLRRALKHAGLID